MGQTKGANHQLALIFLQPSQRRLHIGGCQLDNLGSDLLTIIKVQLTTGDALPETTIAAIHIVVFFQQITDEALTIGVQLLLSQIGQHRLLVEQKLINALLQTNRVKLWRLHYKDDTRVPFKRPRTGKHDITQLLLGTQTIEERVTQQATEQGVLRPSAVIGARQLVVADQHGIVVFDGHINHTIAVAQ